jgi:Secretion system C-terminal sorting domain
MQNLYKFLLLLLTNFFCHGLTKAQVVQEVTLPNDVTRVNLTVKGAAGGDVFIRGRIPLLPNEYVCSFIGGRGAVIKASYDVGNGANQIPLNSTLRFVSGFMPSSEYIETFLGIASKGNAGGGGSAVLYKAPSSSTWVILVVAGAGGGAYGGMAAYQCTGQNGFYANRNGENGWDGGSTTVFGIGLGLNGIAGQNGNGGGGGGANQSISGGGGGAFTDGTSNLVCGSGQSAAGKKGFPNGGASANCFGQLTSGFGSGGQGFTAGGGGGGYSGGGGGASFQGGGGGGSYVNTFALINNSKETSFNYYAEDGSVQYGYVYSACAGSNLTSNIGAINNVSCKGGSNGTATINYTTTNPANTTFEWFPLGVTGQGTNSVSNLSAGTYFCKVKLTNVNGGTCDSTLHTVVITEPALLSSTTDSISQVKCNGQGNGFVRIKVTGGTKPYTTSAGTTNTDSTIIIGFLPAGNYNVNITDAKGCTKTHTFTITQPGAISNNRVYVNKNATGANSGESWANAFVDLQSALALSKNCTGINEIWVAKGTYYPTSNNDRTRTFLVNGNITIYGGFAGNETSLASRNAGQNNTFLSGNIGNTAVNTDNSYHVVTMNGANNTATIDGFIVQDGYNANAPVTDTLGAGLYVYNTASTNNNVVVQNCVFRNNFSKQGAAVVNDSRASNIAANASKILLQNCLLYNNNIVQGNPGAAIANIGNIPSYGEIKLNNCTVTQNTDGLNNMQILKVGAADVYIFNSIVLGVKNYNALSPNLYTINSCITTATGSVYPPLTGTNIVEDRPFVNAANPLGLDGKLMTADDGLAQQSCSNTVNAGNNTYVGSYTVDIAGNPRRYNNARVDMGAYELQGTAAAADAVLFVNAAAANGGDGASWSTAFNNLQDALNLAASCIDVKEIWVAAGTYYPSTIDATKSFSMVTNVKIYGGFVGNEAALTQRDWVNSRTILSGEIGTTGLADNSYHVIKNININNALLNGFSIEKGYAFAGGINNLGAGIYNSGVTNTKFENIYFNSNRANGGGAMYNTNSPTEISNCVFDANSALSFGKAGAIFNANSNINISNCVFNANIADAGAGAIYNNSSNITVRFSTFYKNQTFVNALVSPSGIENDASNLTMVNTIMWDTIGGANIKNTNAGTATVSYSNIQKAGAAYTGATNTNVDPLFNDPTNGNGNDNKWFTIDDGLHLRKCNTTISNAGTNIPAVTADIIGAARLQGSLPAMGAYETEVLPNRFYSPAASRLYVKPAGNAANTGLSWNNALAELGEALLVAHQNPQIKEIWVAAGTYKPIYDEFYNACGADGRYKTFVIPNGVKIYGGFIGNENSLTQANPASNPTVLSGDIGTSSFNGDNTFHVVAIDNPTAATELNGFIIRDGYSQDIGSVTSFLSAGVDVWTLKGAGVFIYKGGNNFKLSNCNVENNQYPVASGAASYGGGLYSHYASPIIENCVFKNNHAKSGAGCYVLGNGPSFTKVVFDNNDANRGGAIFSFATESLSFEKAIFKGNSATNAGGAVYADDVALTGGAPISINLSNALFVNNAATMDGVDIYQSNCNSKITNATMYTPNKTAKVLFNIFSGNLEMSNSVVHYNQPSSPSIFGGTGFTVNYSNIRTTNTVAGTGNINADPLFLNFNNPIGADNIWFTADDGLQLVCNSPSVNTGTNTNAPVDDILGNSFIGANKEMGAYESRATIPTAPTSISYGATLNQTGTTVYGDCNALIATVLTSGVQTFTTTPINGPTTAKVWVEFVQPSGFVKRHYEITPSNFAANSTGTVTLYFTQQEFNDFNAVNITKLPTSGTDAAGKANLLIEKRGGASNNNTGLPASYTGAISNINPDDAAIVWNATLGRWEITFDVTGFSGFFVKTLSTTLAVRWLQVAGYVNASKKASINFKVQESNVTAYEIEKSIDGSNFKSIATISSKGNGINDYSFIESNILTGTAYYRIKQIDGSNQVIYSNIVKLSNMVKDVISIFPNPTKGNVTIVTTELLQSIYISDITGKILQQIKANQNQMQVDLSAYPSGIYIIKLANGQSQKVVKH